MGYGPWGGKESDMAEVTKHRFRKMSPLHANPTEARRPEEGKEREEQKAAEPRPC